MEACRREHVWILMALMTVIGCAPESEESVILRGELTLEDQATPSEVRVHLGLDGGALVDSTNTNGAGSFVFSGLSRVDYSLTFSKEGYETTIVPALWDGSKHRTCSP